MRQYRPSQSAYRVAFLEFTSTHWMGPFHDVDKGHRILSGANDYFYTLCHPEFAGFSTWIEMSLKTSNFKAYGLELSGDKFARLLLGSL